MRTALLDQAGAPAEMVVGSFTSATRRHIENAGRFCVNVLSARQAGISRLSGQPADRRFEGFTRRDHDIVVGKVDWIG